MNSLDEKQKQKIKDFLNRNSSVLVLDVEHFEHDLFLSSVSAFEDILKCFSAILVVCRDSSCKKIEIPLDGKLSFFHIGGEYSYGARQKLIYNYVLDRFDFMIMFQSKSQFCFELLPHFLLKLAGDAPDALFAVPGKTEKPNENQKSLRSHFLSPGRFANWLFQKISGQDVFFIFTPYKAFRIKSLSKLPFNYNDDSDAFDLELIIQFHLAKFHLAELEISREWDSKLAESSRLHSYYRLVRSLLKIRLMSVELFYDPRFDIVPEFADDAMKYRLRYLPKRAATSVHGKILSLPWKKECRLIDIGGGRGEAVACPLADRGLDVTVIDLIVDSENKKTKQYKVNLNQKWDEQFPAEKYDAALALDILEHLNSPEGAVREIYSMLNPGARLYASTGNIGFFITRFMLLFGFFNYGRRGILDMTHQRLFTISTFRRLLRNEGFVIRKVYGFGPPLADIANHSLLFQVLDRAASFAARVWPSLCAYQIMLEAERKESLKNLEER